MARRGILGVVAGYLSRGLLIGVAVPALGAGLTWLLLRTSGAWPEPEGRGPTLGDLVGAAALVLGVAAAAQGALVLASSSAGEPLPRALGVALLKKPPVESTFDLTLRQLGHALFPWSAFLPFAVGRLFRAPAADRAGEGVSSHLDREAGVRIALIVTSALAYGAFALLAPHAGALPFSGPALLAAIAALAIRDLERGAPSSRALAVGCAVLAFVLYRDLVTSPDRALSVFSVDKPVFPKSFEGEAASAMHFVLLAFAGLVSLTWFEEQPRELDRSFGAWARRLLDEVHAGAAELARIWNGNLLFLLIVIEAALVGVGAMLFVGKRIGWGTVARMPNHLAAYGMNAWWALPMLLAASPVLLLVARDAFRHAVARASVPRAVGTPLAGLVAGFALSFWYYPALAAQLSPKEVFASYESLRKPGEPLATLGVRSRTAAYYQGGEVTSFTDVLAGVRLAHRRGELRGRRCRSGRSCRSPLARREVRRSAPVEQPLSQAHQAQPARPRRPLQPDPPCVERARRQAERELARRYCPRRARRPREPARCDVRGSAGGARLGADQRRRPEGLERRPSEELPPADLLPRPPGRSPATGRCSFT